MKLAFCNDMAGVFIDRFGVDIPIRPHNKTGWSETSVEVAVSDQFLGWIFALGPKVRIISPASVTEHFKSILDAMSDLYTQA